MLSDPKTKQEIPLLRTKISIPQLPPVFVQRSGLLKQITQGVRGPLTLLTAGIYRIRRKWDTERASRVSWGVLLLPSNGLES